MTRPASVRGARARRAFLLAAVPALALGACGDKGGDSNPVVYPDLEGFYNVIIVGSTGCEGDKAWITWANGPLHITGTHDALTFDFSDGMAFVGGVDATGGYNFSGDVEYTNPDTEVVGALEVVNTGRFTWDAEFSEWAGEGEFEVKVTDTEFVTDTCTVTAPITISQF